MIIRIFRSGYVPKIIIFLIIALSLWIPAFLSPPEMVITPSAGIGYEFLANHLSVSNLAATSLAFVLLLLQAVVLNAVLIQNPLFSRSVFLPAMIYMVLMSYDPTFLSLHPALIANFFLIFSLKNLFNTYEKNEAFLESFNTSIFVAFASLFYWPAMYMMLLVWFAFLIFRISSWREWVISIIGFGTPYLFLFAGFYLLNNPLDIHHLVPHNILLHAKSLELTLNNYIFWPVFSILFLVAYYIFNRERTDKIISIRKGLAVVNSFFLLALFSLVFAGQHPTDHVFLIFLPASVIFAFYFIETKKVLLPELLFLALLISIGIIKFL